MKNHSTARTGTLILAALAGTASCTVSALADAPVGPLAPIVVTDVPGGTDLGGESIPAGTYLQFTMVFDWSDNVGPNAGAYSSEATVRLANQAALAGATVYAGPYGAYDGYNIDTARTLHLDAGLRLAYSGGQPLFLIASQEFVPSECTWSNTEILLKTAAPALPTAQDIGSVSTPAIAQPFNAQQFTYTLGLNEVKWYTFTTTSSATNASGRFLDLDTNMSTLFPSANDATWMFLYDASGKLLLADSLDGEGGSSVGVGLATRSQMSFGGSSVPRPTVGPRNAGNSVSAAYDGRDGDLPAGTYYVAICGEGQTENFGGPGPLTTAYDGFKAFSGAQRTGTIFFNIRAGTVQPPPTCAGTDAEPNSTKDTAQVVTVSAPGDAICGATSGFSSGAGTDSADFFRIRTAQSPAGTIQRHRVVLSASQFHQLSMRGSSQTNGVLDVPSTALLVNSIQTTVPPRMLQWYTLGTNPTPELLVRVINNSTTADPNYQVQYQGAEAVTVADIGGGPFNAGTITIDGNGFTATDTDMWVYDADLNAIAGYGNDDQFNPGGGRFQAAGMTRTFAPGTYYIAISNFDLMNNQTAPTDDAEKNFGGVIDSPGVLANSSSNAAVVDLSFGVTDSAGTRPVFISRSSSYEIQFLRFTVVAVGNGGCQAADIADDQGNPLPSANINTGVNEGDYNAFFAGFFEALAYCDQWDDAGIPLSNPGAGLNNGVNEGDYNGFFATFFNGCP